MLNTPWGHPRLALQPEARPLVPAAGTHVAVMTHGVDLARGEDLLRAHRSTGGTFADRLCCGCNSHTPTRIDKMKMRRLVAPLALAGVLVGLPPALAADNAQDFVAKAAQGGMFEVKSSEAIQGKAQDPRINDFAQTMIKDHGAANAKLQTIAGEEKL